MWNSFINKFSSSEKNPNTIVQPIAGRTTLYVKKVGNGDYMVSHLALDGGYDKYDKNGSDCWTSDGVSSVVTTTGSADATAGVEEGVFNAPEDKKSKRHITKDADMVADTTNDQCKTSYKESINYTDAINKTRSISGYSDIQNTTLELLKHIDIRFTQLKCLIKEDTKKKVVIAGTKGDNRSTLGIGLARGAGQWGVSDSIDKPFKLRKGYKETTQGKCYDIMIGLITAWCNDLIKDYPKQVSYGSIGINQKEEENEMTNDVIHVWGANITNFNKSNDDKGGGQAAAVRYENAKDKTSNAAGAFGIITTPVGATAKTIADYNEELLKLFKSDSAGGSKPRNRTRSKKRRNSRKSK